ncbi:L-fuculose 1-phosphate aldolase [Hasllibacter halocynthiae]|uniref:L-fuculose 1-phosphate aldolase n=1 Tax=Hasllibacter halocynthiae TaxID=595589 RepID=A0A2T0X2B7_9RHOB|nr:class II aldolase/adducin family protein [Hasllibacter halocynthiae]PRY93092.1 L-fuculose 1-phosphate aldolase [Hasllibacter halocynthiae]
MTLDPNDVEAKKDALIAAARRCFETGLQTNAGGNLSVRLSAAEAVVIKPSGVGFAEVARDNLQVAWLDGRIEPSALKPSKDLDFHLAIYRARDDVNAVVHCHSPWATGWACAGLEIPCCTVQTIEKIGRMPLIPLSPNGGPQTEAEIGPVFADPSVRAAVLANHGTIGVGPTLTKALHLAEIIEETAQVAFVRDGLMAARGMAGADLPRFGTAADARAAG